MNRRWVIFLLMAGSFLLAALYGVGPLFLPTPKPASILSDQFSAERAFAYVQDLAAYPRVAGMPGMDQAVAYLVQALQACHLSPEVQDAYSPYGMLHNVVVRLPGLTPGNAFLVVTHVDSVSYGAGDNATGVGVLVDAACALQAGEQLNNDLVLLFEDGEELGYLGGYAFAKSDPSIPTIRRVIGLDTAAWGPVVLLQTTPGNWSLIHSYAVSVIKPTAFGFFANADWTISHDDSEIQPFYEQGIPGLELEDPTAFTGKHSTADTPDHIYLGSMQQMGDQVLSLIRQLGGSDLAMPAGSDFSYFTLWGLGVVRYYAGWNILLVSLAGLGLGAVTVQGVRQKSFSIRSLIMSRVFMLLAFVGAGGFGWLGSVIFTRLFPNPNPSTGSYLVPASLPSFVLLVGVVMAAFLAVRWKLVQVYGSAVTYGGLWVWLVVSGLVVGFLRIGSYLFTIPFLIAIGLTFLPPRLKLVRLIPAIVATLLLAPNIALSYLGAGLQPLVLVTFLVAMNMELWAEAGLSAQ